MVFNLWIALEKLLLVPNCEVYFLAWPTLTQREDLTTLEIVLFTFFGIREKGNSEGGDN